MKLFKRSRKLIGSAFNTKGFMNQQQVLLNTVKKIFTMAKAKSDYDFNDLHSLGLDKEKLNTVLKKFRFLYVFFSILALLVMVYAICLFIKAHLLASILAISVAFMLGAHAFKFHFWTMQIKKRKLGCSISEWWKYIMRSK